METNRSDLGRMFVTFGGAIVLLIVFCAIVIPEFVLPLLVAAFLLVALFGIIYGIDAGDLPDDEG